MLDNDKGLKSIQTTINNYFKTKISISDDQSFYKIYEDIYVVKTPHLISSQESSIEDFLDPSIWQLNLDGKTFSSNDNYDISKHFGKVILSDYLYTNRSNFVFTGLNQILSRISAALLDP